MALKNKAPDSSAEAAYIACIRLLGRREYSKAELMRKLNGRFTREAASEGLRRCVAEGAQSDERFAQMLVRHAVSAHLGPQRLRLEAVKRDFDPDELEPYMDEVDFDAIALEYLKGHYQDTDASDFKTAQKMKSALYRRGFELETCVYAVEQFSS